MALDWLLKRSEKSRDKGRKSEATTRPSETEIVEARAVETKGVR